MSKLQFVYVTCIETTPERLWEALTSSEFTGQYRIPRTALNKGFDAR